MNAAIKLVGLGRSARNVVQIKVRQPLAEMKVKLPGEISEANVAPLLDVVAEEINVKKVTFIADTTQVAEYTMLPNLKELGPKLGSAINAVKAALAALPEAEIKKFLALKELKLSANGQSYTLSSDEVQVRLTGKDGFAVAADGGYLVAIDTTITPELSEEGLKREILNKVQNLRKEVNYVITDRIVISGFQGDPTLQDTVRKFESEIKAETLGVKLIIGPVEQNAEIRKDVDLNGLGTAIGIRRAKPEDDSVY